MKAERQNFEPATPYFVFNGDGEFIYFKNMFEAKDYAESLKKEYVEGGEWTDLIDFVRIGCMSHTNTEIKENGCSDYEFRPVPAQPFIQN